MPRISLYRPERGNDYKFIDRQVNEMFQVGGTDVYIHKYIGPMDPTNPDASLGITGIQDLVFLENRDRKYDPDIYKIRGIYNVQDLDFNLSQFGLMIDNDTVMMTVHINNFIETMGRKPINGDVIELPHLTDQFALGDLDVSLPRYYVISDVGRAAEGFSPTWYPHLYRLKLTKIVDSQQYKEIFEQKIVDPVTLEETSTTLRDILSTYNKSITINDASLAEAEANAPKSGYETQHFYTLAVDDRGQALLETVDDNTSPPDASSTSFDASRMAKRPQRNGYSGYITGDGIAPNGVDFGHGIQFPQTPASGDFFLRTDFMPNRLYRYDGVRWVKFEDNVRTTLSNTTTKNTFKGTFINNSNKTGVDLLVQDFYTPTVDTYTYQTTEPFTTGMYASAVIGDGTFPIVTVTSGLGSNALLTFSELAPAGSQVQWKLYRSSIDERVALSKAMKPKADL